MEILASILQGFTDQSWFQMVGEITFMASALAAATPDRWKVKKDGGQRTWYKWGYGAIEFMAINVFNAKSKNAVEKLADKAGS